MYVVHTVYVVAKGGFSVLVPEWIKNSLRSTALCLLPIRTVNSLYLLGTYYYTKDLTGCYHLISCSTVST